MVLASPVYSPSDTRLFDVGHRLLAKDIQRLKEWGFTAVGRQTRW
jgi:hypothetical protein